MVTDLPASALSLVTADGDEHQGDPGDSVPDDEGNHRQCGECGFTFPVDDPTDAEPPWWVCSPCAVALLGGGSLQRRAVAFGGSTTLRTVFSA